MITPEEFPYIKALHVNDCYAYQDFNIELHDYKPFSHLILTGKNGSGKSTILKIVNNHIIKWRNGEGLDISLAIDDYATIKYETEGYRNDNESFRRHFSDLFKYGAVVPDYGQSPHKIFHEFSIMWLYSYFKAKRTGDVLRVEAPSKEAEFIDKFNSADSTEFFVSKFKQYLVNRKVEQAFSQIEQQMQRVQDVQLFFDSLKNTLNEVFEGTLKDIEFNRSNYEFYLTLSDNRRLTFNTLSEGFSASISIFMDLFVRVDLIRKQLDNYSYNPCGIVLIDEPETHLHLQLQEQVLPLLTRLFPNIQFITATHSPAVIASIKQATIFDLTTKESRTSEETAGRSYSDLMMSHFGLDNEYSATADAIIKQVNDVLTTLGDKPAEMKVALQAIYDENSDYLSPTLQGELELLIMQHEVQKETAQ